MIIGLGSTRTSSRDGLATGLGLALGTVYRTPTALAAANKPIFVDSNPSEDFLKSEGVKQWGTWGCGVEKFPWTWSVDEKAYAEAWKVNSLPGATPFVPIFPFTLLCCHAQKSSCFSSTTQILEGEVYITPNEGEPGAGQPVYGKSIAKGFKHSSKSIVGWKTFQGNHQITPDFCILASMSLKLSNNLHAQNMHLKQCKPLTHMGREEANQQALQHVKGYGCNVWCLSDEHALLECQAEMW
eukprot:1159409-Pelagomonas_calceolata.AAC.1